MNKNTLYILFAATIAMTGGLFAQSLINTSQTKQTLSAVEFKLPDLTGKIRNSSEWQGKVRIINFWATWCPPCLKEIPEFIQLQNELNDKNVQFIGIAIEDKASVGKYVKTIPINYPILIGGDEGIQLSRQLGNQVNAVPFTLILNPEGQVIHRHPGELSKQKILQIVTPLIK